MATNAQEKPETDKEEVEASTGNLPDLDSMEPDFEAIKAEYEQKYAEQKDQLLRTMADLENTRKRAERERDEASKYAATGFARDLVNVIENLRLASLSIPAEAREGNPHLKTIAEGVDMTMREFLNMLERHGIKRVDPMGEKFDHNFHQAVVQMEDGTKEPGTVVQVMQAGYVMHDRLLRPAMVGVAKAPGEAAQPQRVDTQA